MHSGDSRPVVNPTPSSLGSQPQEVTLHVIPMVNINCKSMKACCLLYKANCFLFVFTRWHHQQRGSYSYNCYSIVVKCFNQATWVEWQCCPLRDQITPVERIINRCTCMEQMLKILTHNWRFLQRYRVIKDRISNHRSHCFTHIIVTQCQVIGQVIGLHSVMAHKLTFMPPAWESPFR